MTTINNHFGLTNEIVAELNIYRINKFQVSDFEVVDFLSGSYIRLRSDKNGIMAEAKLTATNKIRKMGIGSYNIPA